MCFSAPASFIAAGVTGAIGLGCLAKVRTRREAALAAMPLLFAVQQGLEGLLWLTLPVAPHAPQVTVLTVAFLLFAKVFWPVYVPLTTLLIEPDARRRKIMAVTLAGGIAIAIYFVRSIWASHPEASILGGHIVYEGPTDLDPAIVVAYLAATCVAPLVSSHVAVRWLALVVTTGMMITFTFYWEAFTSVWCFFAAVASAILYGHFARVSRMSEATAR